MIKNMIKDMIKKINKRIVFYIVFAVFMVGFFLYLRFPGYVVEKFIIAGLSERYPETFISLQSVSLSFPPGLKLENAIFGFKDNREANFRAEQFRVRPRFLGYIYGRSSFLVNVLAYDGVIKGFVNFPLFFAKKGTEKAEIGFENLDIEKCAYLRDKLGRRITGRLGGTFTYDGDGNDGKLNFYLQKGSYQLLENMFGFEKLDFNNIEGQIGLKNGALKISKLTLKGEKISYSLKGDILLNSELKNSVINLSGNVEIAAMNNKKMQMLITGTIGNAITRYL